METIMCMFEYFLLIFIIDNLFQGYLPAIVERRDDTLTRKRDEYWSYVRQYYHTRTESEHQDTFRQVFDFDEVMMRLFLSFSFFVSGNHRQEDLFFI